MAMTPDAVIGIDPSFEGFAMVALTPDRAPIVFREHYPKTRFGDGVDRIARIQLDVLEWLENLTYILEYTIAHVALENHAYAAKYGREKMGGLSLAVRLVLRAALPLPACYPTKVAPTRLKVFATGHGGASKADMVAGVQSRWGVNFTDHNIADAYALARIAEGLHRLTCEQDLDDYREHERAVLTALAPHTEMYEAA